MEMLSKITYGIIEEKNDLNKCDKNSYGIIAYEDGDNNATNIVAISRNITADRYAISSLVEKCNRISLSPIHLNDVIEDFFK